jgi:type III pantothenate kinase
MRPDVVVDVGNTRIKWGRCSAEGVAATASLPPDDPVGWQEQARRWRLPAPATWAVTGVHPPRRETFAAWLRERGDRVEVIDAAARLPLRVPLEHPDGVGIDRLLDAVAANSRRRPGVPAVLIDAGSAITVDRLDETGAFRGGAILPGMRLMAQALHDYTALLPLIEVPPPRGTDCQSVLPALPGPSTTAALQAGIFWAAAGGVRAVCEEYAALGPTSPDIFLTGGDAPALRPVLDAAVIFWPKMTLEGVRLSAEALP